MNDWLDALAQGWGPGVRVAVAGVKGSTPREPGAGMLVTRDGVIGTIGGGNLEYQAIQIARQLLEQGEGAKAQTRRFPLGPALGQCCGGVALVLFDPVAPRPPWVLDLARLRERGETVVLVTDTRDGGHWLVTAGECLVGLADRGVREAARELLNGDGPARLLEQQGVMLEPLRPCDFRITLFGAGHVGQALVQVLQGLPCRITWVDQRAEQFPAALPDNIRVVVTDQPLEQVDAAPPGSYFLVMTHSHPLDQAIVARILSRGDFRYCGLIGSESKRRSFRKRLLLEGVSLDALERLICPIGLEGLYGKHPTEIAIAVAAQLLQVRQAVAVHEVS